MLRVKSQQDIQPNQPSEPEPEPKMPEQPDNPPPIRFWYTSGLYGPLSNFARFGFVLDGKQWPTSEHYYQAQKTLDPALQEAIRQQPTAKLAKQLAQTVQLRPDWEAVKYNVMKTALLAKFSQMKSLRELLLSTGDQQLIEASPYDYVWGCGKDGTGQNLLGQCLMEVREQLKQENAANSL